MSSGLNNPLVRRMNCIRISVKDCDIFKLKYSCKDQQTFGPENVLKFSSSVIPSALKNVFFRNNLIRYRYVRFNSFAYYVYIECLNWTLTGQYKVGTRTEPYHYPVGFIQGFQGTPFFLNWDLDNKYVPATPTDDRLSSDPHSKTVIVSSKRPKVFRYNVPAMVSRYLDCAKVFNVSTDKDVGAFLEECCGQGNFRAPNNWFGEDKKQIAQISEELPVQFKLYVTCHVDCTFKGYKYV